MARAKLTALTFSTKVTPHAGSWTFPPGRAALSGYRKIFVVVL
jgi:hypothetical protein